MDATTKQKTLSVFIAALLVGSVVLAAATAVASHAGDPTRQPGANRERAVVEYGPTVTIPEFSVTVNPTVEPASGIIFNNTYDFTVTNLTGAENSVWRLFAPNGVQVGNNATAYGDEAHLGRVNVTIFAQTFNTVGTWTLTDGTTTASFFVRPQNNLLVTVNPATFVYTGGGQFVDVFVTNLTPGFVGQPVGDARVTGFNVPSGANTLNSGTQVGHVLYTAPLPGVGTYLVEARRDTNGDGLPEYYGNTTVSVAPGPLTITAADTVVRAGFAENSSWDITYPNGSSVFRSAGGVVSTPFNWANVTVNLPNGSFQWVNFSGTVGTTPPVPAGECATVGFPANRNAASLLRTPFAEPHAPCTPVVGAVFQFSAGGRLYYRPAAEWPAGTYTLTVRVNLTEGSDLVNSVSVGNNAAEYATVGAAPITTTAPAAVNLKLFNNTFGGDQFADAAGKGFRVPYTNAGPTAGPLGAYTVVLQVLGSASTETPLPSFFGASNVTVSGDVLPVLPAQITYPHGSNGLLRITGLTPTKVNGNVTIAVTWKDQTASVRIPIQEGADSTVDKPEIVVDQTSTLTVTVRDAYGNPVPSASVALLNTAGRTAFPGIGDQVINGTGAPGLGQNGQYTFSVRPTTTGDLIVYSTIGTVVAGVNNQNFTYARVRVVPAHDLTVTLSTNSSMAGNRTYVYMNATMAGGHAVTTTGNFLVYFLNQTQLGHLRVNGTSALAGITSPQGLVGAAGVNVELGAVGLTGTNLNVSLDPGTYYVYVCSNQSTTPATSCDGARHDNINNTPTFTATPWHAVFTPDRIASNAQLQSNTQVTARVTDNNGVAAPSGSVVRVRSGAAHVVQTLGSFTTNATGYFTFTVTGQSIGDLVFEVDVSGAPTHFTALDTPFRVVGPNVQVTPDRIPLGRASTLVIKVASLNGTALPNLTVQVCGTPIGGTESAPGCTGNVTTDAAGLATVGVNPSSTGNMTLRVTGINSNVNVTVFAGLEITLSKPTPLANETQEITVAVIGQTGGEAGVLVNVTMNGTAVSGFPQTTGSTGRVFVTNLQAGNYTVTATKPGFDPKTVSFTVGAAPSTPTGPVAQFTLSNLTAPATANVGQGLLVTAVVRNVGGAAGTANVLLLVNGAVRDSQQVPVAPGQSETVGFDFTPNTAGTFQVTVRLAGQDPLPARSVAVTLPPGGGTPTPASPTTPTGGTPATPPTTPTGATPTNPTGATPTPSPSPQPSPEVPGFEVVALVAALGVALLVLRRRS